MPIYEYVCSKCGFETDVLQKLSDPPPSTCDKCGKKKTLKKKMSRTSFQLKGGGWYKDLYGSVKPTTEAPTTPETSDKKDAAKEATPAPATAVASADKPVKAPDKAAATKSAKAKKPAKK